MDTKEYLHNEFNRNSDQIPPVRIKGFGRTDLAQLFAELGFRNGAEIGVADAQNSLVLCQNIPNLKLLCVDPWEPYHENRRGGGKDQQHGNYELAKERLAPYNATLIRAMSMDAAKDVVDGSLDFVFIDGNHGFDFVMRDIIEWSKKVREGGIVSGHDYYRFKWAGVMDAVDAYTKAHQINEWFIDDHRETSYFWSRP